MKTFFSDNYHSKHCPLTREFFRVDWYIWWPTANTTMIWPTAMICHFLITYCTSYEQQCIFIENSSAGKSGVTYFIIYFVSTVITIICRIYIGVALYNHDVICAALDLPMQNNGSAVRATSPSSSYSSFSGVPLFVEFDIELVS